MGAQGNRESGKRFYQFEGPIGSPRAGRRARFSFLATDDQGKPIRKWHADPLTSEAIGMNAFTEQDRKSLRGMVNP